MSDKIQAALQAYQKRKSRAGLSDSVSAALDSYTSRKRSNAQSTATDLAERINSEIETIKSVATPDWGADSLKTTLTNTNDSRVNLSKLQKELTANKNYMDSKTYNSLATTLKQLQDSYDSYIKTAEARSHFDSEDAYNKWFEQYQREEAERNAILNAEDFAQYEEAGKNVENPSWDAARAPFDIGGWRPFGEGDTINNMVTFAEANGANAFTAMGQGMLSGRTHEDAELAYLINTQMKPEEKSIYNYYIGKGDYTKANEYLTKLTDTMRQRQADQMVAQADNNALELIFSAVAGLDQFRAGVANIDNLIMGTEADPTSAIQYAQSTMSGNNEGVWKFFNDLTTTTANMLPSIGVGVVTGGIGGALTLGASASGNAYAEMLQEGYTPDQARWYGVLTGASETALSAVLGGIGSLGGKLTGKSINALVQGIKNTSLRLAAQIPLNMVSEGLEEGLQTVLEPVIKSMVTGEAYTPAQIEEVLYSSLLGAVSAGAIEGIPGAYKTAKANKAASDMYGAKSKQLVEEAMSVQNNSELRKLAEKYQERVKTGKQLTGGQINGLIETMDTAKLKTSILQRLGELGETSEVSAVTDVLMKFAQGEKLSASDLTTLDNSKAGYKVMTEMDRQNIESGGLGAENRWAESIGTRRINPDIYNKTAYDAVERAIQARKDAEKASVENTMTEAEKSAEGKYKVSESGKTMLSATGAEVDVKRIVSTDGGKVKVMLSNGKTVNASDLSYATAEEGIMYEMVARLGASPNSANVIMNAFKPTDANEARQYLASVPLAYGYGKIGNKAGLANINLPDSAKQMLYEHGRADAKATAEAKAKATPTVAKKAQKTANGKSVIFEGFEYNESNLNDLQKASMPAIEFISDYSSLEVHVFSSEIVDGKRVATIDGKRVSAPNGYFRRGNEIWLDINAGNLGEGAMLYTMSHEITHYIRQWNPKGFKDLADFLIAEYNKNNVPINDLIEEQKEKIRNRLTEEKKAIPDPAKLFDMAYEEMVCDAMSQMLADPKAYEKLAKMKQSKPGLWKKIGEAIKALLDKIKSALGVYSKNATPDALEAVFTNELTAEAYEKLQNLYLKAFVEADANYEVAKSNGFAGKYLETKDISYNLRAAENHMSNLEKQFSKDASISLETLTQRYNKIIDLWKNIGGELNSKFLTEWNNKVGKDRAFTVFKAQAGYKYNVELSSMCKKGVPLFEAIDTIVKEEVMKELDTKVLGKEEKEILYDILKSHHFEIPCAICYVEQARQREGTIIDAFLNGRVEKNNAGKVTTFKLGWNEVLKAVQNEMKAFGVDYTFASVNRSIATDKYVPADITMDEATQNAFYKALKKIANKEIARYNKEEGKRRKLVTDVTPSAIKSVFSGTLPSNLKIFKVLFTEPSSRLIIESDLLYSSMTTHNLATAHNSLYSLFNSQGGVSGYKTKQGTVVYWGDILNKTWNPAKVRDEGGIRNQSNSDFQMYTLLDQAQMYIDFTAKGYYLQAYTKVLSELKLFGLSRGKINASLIPAVYEYRNADGSVDVETTRANAGLDKNGELLFDDIEGINHTEAFMLLEDVEYSKSLGGTCIGYSDAHILKLLDDNRVQQIIGFHDKTDDPSKRYRGARYAKNYNGLNEAVNKDGKTVHLGFNPYVRKAEKKFTFNADTETYEGEIVFNGKTYVADDIPKLAADMYLDMCREKNYTPAYADFDFHENYYKLLADFSLYDSQGHYAPHRKVAYNMPAKVPYLDSNGAKQYMHTKDYIKAELEKELKVRDAISEALADKSENGLIPQFVKRVNESRGENNDISYSVREIVGDSGKSYGIGVYLDSTLLTDLTEEERVEMVKEYVKELGGSVFTAYDNNHNAVDVHIVESNKKFRNKNGKRVPVYNHMLGYLKGSIKQEAIALVDELIITSSYKESTPSTHSHGWVDNNGANDWESWITYLQDKENTVWEATLKIANSTNGEKILYEIYPIKMVEQSVKPDTSTTITVEQSVKSDTSTTDKIITHPKAIVKSEFSGNNENYEMLSDHKKIGSPDQVLDLNPKDSSNSTPEAVFGDSATSKKSISQSANTVKGGNENISFSNRDSDGNKLSKAQQEFFAESKARDEDGNLLVLYHGTSTEEKISEFLTTEGSRTGLWMSTDHGTGAHFAGGMETARLFTKENRNEGSGKNGVYMMYANLKNPLIVDAQARRYWQIPRPAEMGDGDAYISGEEINLFAEANNYDGVIIRDVIEGSDRMGTDVVVFNPNQVKYVDNLNPTEGNDISFHNRGTATNIYDYSKLFAEQIDDYKQGLIPKYDTLLVSGTPEVWKKVGFNALPVTINQTHVDYALNGTKDFDHHIGEALLKTLPEAIKSPVAIIQSQSPTNNDRAVVILQMTHNGKQVVGAVEVDGHGRTNDIRIDSNAMASLFAKDNALKQLKNAINNTVNGAVELFYWNKKEAMSLMQRAGLQLPSGLPRDGFVYSIHDNGSKVKSKFKNITETQQFKRWFGDWQKHPELASKIVNDDGTPMILYHGTNAIFSIFDAQRISRTTKRFVEGFYFTAERKVAEKWSRYRTKENGGEPNVVAVYLDVKNPFVLTDMEYKKLSFNDKYKDQVLQTLIANKHDGIVVYPEKERIPGVFKDSYNYDIDENVYTNADKYGITDKDYAWWLHHSVGNPDFTALQVAVFSPNQIKSATDNIGTYDRGTDDINFSERSTISASNRSLLANALESVTENAIEKEKLTQYQSKIAKIEAEQARLAEITAEANKIRFTKGRTKSDTERMRKLEFEANIIANRIKTFDKQLLNLESTTALKNVLEREKKQLRQRLQQRGREALKEQRQKDAETVKELMAMHQESRKKAIENRNKTALRNKIRDFKAKLQRNLQHPTDRVYIPAGLASAIVDICNLIDTDKPLIKADGTPNKAQERRSKTKEKLLTLKAEYDKLKSDPDALIAAEYEEAVSKYFATLQENYANKSLMSMSLDELTQMYDVLKSIEGTLRDARKTIGWAEAEDIYAAGDAIAKEQADLAKKRKRNKRGAVQKANDWLVDYTLSPVRAVERMAGYHEDSYLTKMFHEFEKGTRVKNLFIMRAYKLFESLTQGKEFDDAIYKEHGDTYTDSNGKKFRVSKMQMMQAILSYQREVANDMNHISTGGFTFADLALLKKGNLREAISAENAHSVNAALAAKMIAQFSMDLANDQWAQEYMRASREFFDGMAKEAVNETYLKLKHRIIARDANYIPFETDTNYVVREISARNNIQQTINSYGMLQDTKEGASQPLIISGLNNMLDRHIEQVGSIKGLAVAVRDFNKIWNVRTTNTGIGNDPTVKGAIEQYRGTGAVKLITDTVQDIQGARPNTQSWLYRKIKSGYITAKFALNLSVVMKQIGSLFTANSMLKWRNPASAIGNLIYTMAHAKEISAEVDKYTAAVWMRRQGLSDSELHTLATEAKKPGVLKLANKILSPQWITGMDTMVALSLWKYAKEDTAARTGLEGEELLKATAEFYDAVIENTQSMSDVLHRPEVQKRSDLLSETLGMFKTDLYQSAGQLRTTLGKFLADKSKENAAALGRTVYGIVASTLWSSAIVASLVAALRYKVDPYRDDEDEDITLESWLQRLAYGVAGELAGYVNPLAGGELADMFESVMYGESTDEAVDSLVITAINDLISTMTNIASNLKEGEAPSGTDLKKIAIKALEVFGLPANNIFRTVDSISLHAQDIQNSKFLSFEAGVDRTAAEHIHRFVEAYVAGDFAKAGELFGEAMAKVDEDEKEAKTKLKSALGSKYKDGEVSRETVEQILQTYFGMDKDEVYWKLDEWDFKIENGNDADYSKYQDFYDAVSTGKNLKTVIREYTSNGVDTNTLASRITTYFKPIYISSTRAERARLKGYLLNAYAALGYARTQKSKDIDAWLKG